MIEPSCTCFAGFSYLTQRGDVVENPERTPMRRYHQVIAMNREITHRADWQIELQSLPMIPIIERHVDSKFSTGEEQPFALSILANCAQESRRRNTIGD
jgi:hypothetical protein